MIAIPNNAFAGLRPCVKIIVEQALASANDEHS